jgi:hypothetical protein
MKKTTFLLLTSLTFFFSCQTEEQTLFDKFQNPSVEAKPMMRWWWSGNAIEADEIKRELVVMHKAGVGGVEINSIAMSPQANQMDKKSLQWAGKEWCNMIKVASQEATRLGMITDLIVGSGWPFGGKFLNEDETVQRIGVKKQNVKANSTVNIEFTTFLKFRRFNSAGSKEKKKYSDVELKSVKLIPLAVGSIDAVIDITSKVKNNKLNYKVGDKDYVLVVVYNERDFKSVYFGSPGADGPIMDHYNEKLVFEYLNRLKAIERETGIPLKELIRALFCDSIELAGSNWTDDMSEQFQTLNGYDVTPYLPFVIQPHEKLNKYETTSEFAETISRVQYDFYNTIIKLFLERFTKNFQKFCTDNGVLCRYQAYGTPYYMGLFQGYLIPDIPESNNWIYSRGRDEAANPEFSWNQIHGYMLWNKAASGGGHIMGRRIISNEAMTNVDGVFRTSLETIKQTDDLNFITGTNHSVLHGFNYSPPKAGFPGWIRYGGYFSEQNTWWKYFSKWTEYNARLSSVFQNSKPVADIAVVSRLRDTWYETSPGRDNFNNKPWYYSRLWEPISNLGSSCDYVGQFSIEHATIKNKQLVCGHMSYKVVVLTDVKSLTPNAAIKLRTFADAGGKVVFIGEKPSRSLSLKDAKKNDGIVKESIRNMAALELESPKEGDDFIAWTTNMMQKIGLNPNVEINKPQTFLYTMNKYLGDQEVFFFTNSHREKAISFEASFPINGKVPYIWIPETGERFTYPFQSKVPLSISLDALESVLIVFDTKNIDLPKYEVKKVVNSFSPLQARWDVQFNHANGTTFERTMKDLVDFKDANDKAIRDFAGVVTYSTILNNNEAIKYIRLSDVNQGVTELYLNGKKVGTRWYGNHLYDVSSFIKEGDNQLEIKLTNTLANYCGSLDKDKVARFWTHFYETPVSSGLVGVEVGK